MIIEIISHLRVPGSSSSSKRNEQFEAIPMLKDFVRVADLQWCYVLSTNLIRSEIFCCWKSISILSVSIINVKDKSIHCLFCYSILLHCFSSVPKLFWIKISSFFLNKCT